MTGTDWEAWSCAPQPCGEWAPAGAGPRQYVCPRKSKAGALGRTSRSTGPQVALSALRVAVAGRAWAPQWAKLSSSPGPAGWCPQARGKRVLLRPLCGEPSCCAWQGAWGWEAGRRASEPAVQRVSTPGPRPGHLGGLGVQSALAVAACPVGHSARSEAGVEEPCWGHLPVGERPPEAGRQPHGPWVLRADLWLECWSSGLWPQPRPGTCFRPHLGA